MLPTAVRPLITGGAGATPRRSDAVPFSLTPKDSSFYPLFTVAALGCLLTHLAVG